MYNYNITYTDFDGNEKTEKLYFHLTKADMLKLDIAKSGKLKDILEAIVADGDEAGMLYWFDKIIATAYGQRTPEGVFVKDQEKTKAFLASEAYSEFFIKLITQEIPANEFILGILPNEVANQVATELNNNK